MNSNDNKNISNTTGKGTDGIDRDFFDHLKILIEKDPNIIYCKYPPYLANPSWDTKRIRILDQLNKWRYNKRISPSGSV